MIGDEKPGSSACDTGETFLMNVFGHHTLVVCREFAGRIGWEFVVVAFREERSSRERTATWPHVWHTTRSNPELTVAMVAIRMVIVS